MKYFSKDEKRIKNNVLVLLQREKINKNVYLESDKKKSKIG